VNAIISATEDKGRQYTAGMAVGVLACVFGLLSPAVARVMLGTPRAFIAALAGLAMLRVLQSAFATAFGAGHALGALVAFLVTVADVAIVGIGAPFWGLVLGAGVAALLERGEPTT
jgi:benzoate membrane transport protein